MAIVMGWGECSISIAETGASDAMGTPLVDIGRIKEGSTTLEQGDGEKVQAYAVGHKLVAQEESDGDFVLNCRVIEPEFSFLNSLIDGTYDNIDETLIVKSYLVNSDISVKIDPAKVGATGMNIRKSNVTVRHGYTDEEGWYADLAFTVLVCADDELVNYYKKEA